MKITVFSLWRDSVSYIDKALSNIKALESNNKDIEFEYYFYENDSTDDTKKILEDFFRYRKGKLVSEKLLAPKFGSVITPQRMRAMAEYRNKILNFAKPMDSDYSLIWDSDVDFDENILNKFLEYRDEGAMLCPNIRQNVPCMMGSGDDTSYYDSLSLVDRYDVLCMIWAGNPFYDEEDRAKYEKGLPIEVHKAFGGFVLIKSEVLNKESVEWFSNGCLEHWGLCERVREQNEKIIFLPKARVSVTIPEGDINFIKGKMGHFRTTQEERAKMSSWERELSFQEFQMQGVYCPPSFPL